MGKASDARRAREASARRVAKRLGTSQAGSAKARTATIKKVTRSGGGGGGGGSSKTVTVVSAPTAPETVGQQTVTRNGTTLTFAAGTTQAQIDAAFASSSAYQRDVQALTEGGTRSLTAQDVERLATKYNLTTEQKRELAVAGSKTSADFVQDLEQLVANRTVSEIPAAERSRFESKYGLSSQESADLFGEIEQEQRRGMTFQSPAGMTPFPMSFATQRDYEVAREATRPKTVGEVARERAGKFTRRIAEKVGRTAEQPLRTLSQKEFSKRAAQSYKKLEQKYKQTDFKGAYKKAEFAVATSPYVISPVGGLIQKQTGQEVSLRQVARVTEPIVEKIVEKPVFAYALLQEKELKRLEQQRKQSLQARENIETIRQYPKEVAGFVYERIALKPIQTTAVLGGVAAAEVATGTLLSKTLGAGFVGATKAGTIGATVLGATGFVLTGIERQKILRDPNLTPEQRARALARLDVSAVATLGVSAISSKGIQRASQGAITLARAQRTAGEEALLATEFPDVLKTARRIAKSPELDRPQVSIPKYFESKGMIGTKGRPQLLALATERAARTGKIALYGSSTFGRITGEDIDFVTLKGLNPQQTAIEIVEDIKRLQKGSFGTLITDAPETQIPKISTVRESVFGQQQVEVELGSAKISISSSDFLETTAGAFTGKPRFVAAQTRYDFFDSSFKSTVIQTFDDSALGRSILRFPSGTPFYESLIGKGKGEIFAAPLSQEYVRQYQRSLYGDPKARPIFQFAKQEIARRVPKGDPAKKQFKSLKTFSQVVTLETQQQFSEQVASAFGGAYKKYVPDIVPTTKQATGRLFQRFGTPPDNPRIQKISKNLFYNEFNFQGGLTPLSIRGKRRALFDYGDKLYSEGIASESLITPEQTLVFKQTKKTIEAVQTLLPKQIAGTIPSQYNAGAYDRIAKKLSDIRPYGKGKVLEVYNDFALGVKPRVSEFTGYIRGVPVTSVFFPSGTARLQEQTKQANRKRAQAQRTSKIKIQSTTDKLSPNPTFTARQRFKFNSAYKGAGKKLYTFPTTYEEQGRKSAYSVKQPAYLKPNKAYSSPSAYKGKTAPYPAPFKYAVPPSPVYTVPKRPYTPIKPYKPVTPPYAPPYQQRTRYEPPYRPRQYKIPSIDLPKAPMFSFVTGDEANKQKKRYAPTLRAVFGGIKAKRGKTKRLTGLEERPILI